MVSVKFGPIVSDARGSIGGTTFSRSRAGAFARSRRKGVFSQTNLRSSWAANMSYQYDYWLNHTPQADREDWNTLGDNTTFTNALGVEYHPSGWNLFLRTNSLALFFGLAHASLAPASATQAHFEVSYSWHEGNQLIVATRAAGPPFNSAYIFHCGHPLPQTINYSRGPHLFSKMILYGDLGAGADLSISGVYATGDRVFIRDRLRDQSGELSAPFWTIFDCEV